MGSFANTVISFYINGSKLDIFRSICFCGKKPLKFYELIPVISYFALRGRCKECGKGISSRYPMVEVLFVITGLLVLEKFGFTITSVINFAAFSVLLIIAFVDYYKRIIPNTLTAILLTLSIIELFFFPVNIFWRIIAATLVLLIGISVNLISAKYYGKEAIGYGDIKLISVLSLFYGGFMILAALWLSAAAGLIAWIFMRRYSKIYKYEVKIPFGFFLSFGTMFTVLYKYELYRLYEIIILGY